MGRLPQTLKNWLAQQPHAPRHIGLGQGHAGTRVLMLISGLDIRVLAEQTGELPRALTSTTDHKPEREP